MSGTGDKLSGEFALVVHSSKSKMLRSLEIWRYSELDLSIPTSAELNGGCRVRSTLLLCFACPCFELDDAWLICSNECNDTLLSAWL